MHTPETFDGKAHQARSTFRKEVAVGITIAAPPERVWALLYDAAAIPRWNSTVTRIEGTIAPGETIRLQVTVAPGRTFKLKVSDVEPGAGMVWSDGMAPIFRGVRTYRLQPSADGGTRFHMAEVFSGLMLPMINGSLPDFGPMFETYAADLKRAAEAHPESAR